MFGMRVLVVEDERKIAAFIAKGLREAGFAIEQCSRGDESLDRILTEPFDAIVLDIMLPGRDGLSILRAIRESGMDVPVLLLTARSGLDERLEGLNMGADDYLPKPFYMEELVARLHAITRRREGRPASLIRVGNLSLNLLTREVSSGEVKLELTAREFNLLELLARSPGRVFSRTQLYERVWEYDFDPATNLVDVYIRRIRSKIDISGKASLIETIRGVGYRMCKNEKRL